ncbi:MAG: PAS domain-containing protein [Acidimicrobiales bacterium]
MTATTAAPPAPTVGDCRRCLVGRLGEVVDNMADGLSVFDPVRDDQGRIVDFVVRFSNPHAQALLGLDEAQLVGRRCRDLFPGAAEHLIGLWTATLERGEPAFEEVKLHAVDGTASWLHQQVVPIDDGIAVLTEHIADPALAEPDPTGPATGDWTVLEHRLVNPLHAVIGFAELLADSALDPRQQEAVDHLRAAAAELATVVDELRGTQGGAGAPTGGPIRTTMGA